ncbi:DUF1700 domain-containing protein [Massilia sp. Bi118]|uniref:DUF1700 domain-containing protein n=1 Tax=Massilia sp. Bi118 TaxID=2822346 RepID=UPI001E593FEE|nr:DUF1700 domain-containing protein [Massilia sp. Bi118]
MGKLEYLDQLKRAMLGLSPDVQARTLGYYEQRFVDGLNAGRSEQDVAQELDDPKKIAMTLRANSYSAQLGGSFGAHTATAAATATAGGPQVAAPQFNVSEKRNPARVLRVLVSGAGLTIFNLFMIVPAMVFSALLFALYAAALAFYLSGIAITASGLAGNSDLLLDLPTRYVQIDADDPSARRQIRVQIDDTGIHVHEEGDAEDTGDEGRPASRLRRGAEVVAGNSLHVTTDMDADSRTTQTLVGFGMVLGGIAMFLLSLVVTRYTALGIKRYIQMNFSLLKGH